jgi:hypothetical protein
MFHGIDGLQKELTRLKDIVQEPTRYFHRGQLPLTFCGFVSVILACRHLPLKINFIAKIIAQNHC